MLSRFWTAFLISLSGILTIAWLVALMHEKDIRPVRDMVGFFKKQPKTGRVVFGIMFLAFWLVASIKPDGGGNGGDSGGDDGGGTNSVQSVQMVVSPGSGLGNVANVEVLPITSTNAQLEGTAQLGNGNIGTGNISTLATLITSTNTTRTITGDDFRRGFVMSCVGTGEAFDFSAPSNAVVCADWRAFGAATDWIYVALTNWAFQIATNDVDRLRIHSDGWLETGTTGILPVGGGGTGTTGILPVANFWPFMASLGVVPQANWDWLAESDRPSQLWHYVTPSNTLQITWQNALLDRDTDTPLSFQIEFRTDGQFTYRYDLSRLNVDAVTNVLAGASFAGNGWTTNAIPTNITSMTFYPLSAEDAVNPDPDNNGLATIDELFVYHTDPRHPDSDYDGLTDYEELFIYHTDPLDPYSAGGPHCDGLAVKIGDLDPFACPEGSTNTVLEHIFYSGTTNGAFAYPQSDTDTAILKVMVSGVGTGRLVVGDSVVPLVAPPQMRSGTATNILLLTVGRGVRREVWFDRPDGLDVAVKSDDFLIGEMPLSLWPHGWLAFPHVEATAPCIHDFNTRTKSVTLVHGEEFPGMTATWDNGNNGDVAISNAPPVSAVIGGSFPKDAARAISYTLDHPNRLNDHEITIAQQLRFCPAFTPEYETNTVGVAALGDSDSPDVWIGDDPTPYLPDDDVDAEEAFTNIVGGALSPLYDVLYLYRDNTRTEYLEVPNGPARECCPCPEHRNTNYVAKVTYTGNVDVRDAAGNVFEIAHRPCTVTLSGAYPSRAFHDSPVHFVTNGAPYRENRYTVLGVGIESGDGRPAISNYNHRSPSFGYPVAVCTNLDHAGSVVLKTDVLLSNGVVRVALEETSGDVALWLPKWQDRHGVWHPAELLLQADVRTSRHFTIRQWRNLMRRYEQTRQLPVRVVSSRPSRCKVRFEFAASDGEYYVHDYAEQRISTVNPLLLVDYNRDGTIDGTDVAWYLARRVVYFWRNDDEWKDDDAFDLPLFNDVNSSDNVVNGRNDLINFLPVAVDVSPFASNWSPNTVYYRLETYSPSLGKAKLAFADIDWTQIGNAQLGTDDDIDGNSLTNAPVFKLESGTNLPPAFVSLSQTGRSTLFMEFPDFTKKQYLYLNIYSKSDNALLFSSQIEMHIGDTAKMIAWLNLLDVAGGSDGVPTRLATPDWPSEEHELGYVVFVHGYNMAEDVETPLWAKNVFKKLWWSGLDRGFVAVQWRGNEGQIYVPGKGFATPDYYANVVNAFKTASALKNAMDDDDLHGPKWFLAHSLGNVLMCAAIQDYQMPYERYFMLDAAVAMEALDPVRGITQESHDNMTPQTWANYADRVRATHWYDLFPDGDGRRLLTWKGRFCNVTNIVNFYSTQEEVVNNGNGLEQPLFVRNYVWYNQETRKGEWPSLMTSHENEGGWAFNGRYDTVTNEWVGGNLGWEEHVYHKPPAEANVIPPEELRQYPFFKSFDNSGIYTSSNGQIVASNYLYRADLLAYAIPAESFAVGANPLPWLNAYTNTVTGKLVGSRNHNMAQDYTSGRDDLPENHATDTEKKPRDWQHSTFVQRSYKRVHQLFKAIIQYTKERPNE